MPTGHPVRLGADRHVRQPLNGLTRSMGRTGVCWDNAMAESFFATLKTEFYYRRVWPTQARAKIDVGAWIEDRYNRRRRHSALGQISPVQFELQHCNPRGRPSSRSKLAQSVHATRATVDGAPPPRYPDLAVSSSTHRVRGYARRPACRLRVSDPSGVTSPRRFGGDNATSTCEPVRTISTIRSH